MGILGITTWFLRDEISKQIEAFSNGKPPKDTTKKIEKEALPMSTVKVTDKLLKNYLQLKQYKKAEHQAIIQFLDKKSTKRKSKQKAMWTP